MGHIGLPEIIVVVLVILLLFGAKRLPEIGRAFGKAIKEFKGGVKEEKETKDEANKNES